MEGGGTGVIDSGWACLDPAVWFWVVGLADEGFELGLAGDSWTGFNNWVDLVGLEDAGGGSGFTGRTTLFEG